MYPDRDWQAFLAALVARPNLPLGVVVGILTQHLNPSIRLQVPAARQFSAFIDVMGQLDQTYISRADYLLWRVGVHKGPPTALPTEFPDRADRLIDRAQALLVDEKSSAAVFGAAYVLARLLTQRSAKLWSPEVVERTQTILHHSIATPFEAAAISEYAAIRIAVLGLLQQLRFQSGTHWFSSLEECHSHFDSIQHELQLVDNDWQPGSAFGILSIDAERARNSEMAGIEWRIAPCPTSDLMLAIMKTVHAASACVRPRQHDNPFEIVSLSRRALNLAISAWQTARSYAAHEKLNSAHDHHEDNTVSTWRFYEMRNLLQVAKVSRHAGNEALGAVVAQALLCFADDEKYRNDWSGERVFVFAQLGSNLARSIREYGLFVDDRFLRERLAQKDAPSDEGNPAADTTRGKVSDVKCEQAESPATTSHDPYRYRVLADVKGLNEWEVICSELQVVDFDPRMVRNPFGLLMRVISEAGPLGRVASPLSERCIQATHRLLMRYAHLDSAFKLLNRAPNTSRLIDLLEVTEQLAEVTPLAMGTRTHQDWRHAIRKAYARDVGGICAQQAVKIHAALLGGTLGRRATAYATLGDSRLARRALDATMARNSREETLTVLDKQIHNVFAAHPSAAYPQKYQTVDRLKLPAGRWAPVYVSVVRLSSNHRGGRFAVIATDGEQWLGPRVYEFRGAGAYRQKEALFETRDTWLLPQEGVPWAMAAADGLQGLFEEVLSLVEGLGGTRHKWLLLNIDPRLAEVPWQQMLSSCYPRERVKVISIVPGFRWLMYRDQHASAARRLFPLLDESDSSLRRLRELVMSAKRITSRARAAIVVGHGSQPVSDDPELPSVTTGKRKRLTSNGWATVGQNETVIAHVCWGGGTTAHRLGDLAYLPGYLLGMRANLVCAPVIEIPVDVAERFQLRINESLSKPHAEEFGAIYLDAISQNKNIAFYNLYGLANQRLIEESS